MSFATWHAVEVVPPQPEIAVACSTYERADLLPRLVAALEKQTLDASRFEVVICDNGSHDGSFDVLTELAASSPLQLRPLRMETNRGPAGARNAAWRSSSAPLIAFTDDDCVPEPEWLEAGLAALRADEAIGVVQGRTMKPADEGDYPWTPWTIFRDIPEPTPWFEGCNLFFRRAALEQAGGFDERIGWYGEETSLGWSVVTAGWARAFAADAIVRHDLVERGWTYHARQRYLEGNMVAIAKRYPMFRAAFWRPWALQRRNALFALALTGALGAVATRRPILLALTWPYVRARRVPLTTPNFAPIMAQRVAVDAAAFAGMVRMSVKERTLVL